LPSFEYLEEDEEFKELMKKYNIVNLNKETLSDLIHKIFEEIWKSIYDIIKNKEKINEIKDEQVKLAIFNIVNTLESVKNNYNFEIPPFDLRVIIIDIKEDILKRGISRDHEIYEAIFEELNLRLAESKHLKTDPFAKINLTDLTTLAYQKKINLSNRGYEYCTVCGKLPAILAVPTEENDYKNFLTQIGGSYGKSLEPYFVEGEKFCPYCLIKRLITLKEVFRLILKDFFNEINYEVDLNVPSLADISTYDFKKLIIDNLDKEDLINEIIHTAEEVSGESVRILEKTFTSTWRFYTKLFDKIEGSKLSDRQKEELEYFFLYKESENMFLKDTPTKRKWTTLARKHGIDIEPRIYYVLIKSDADNMGKIVLGDVFLPLHLDLEKFEEYRNCYLKEYLKKAYNLEGILSEEELKERISNVINSNKIKTIISFSYHSLVSKSLMLDALIDNLFIEELDGFTIYAGGDDLLALSPVSKSLGIVNETAKSFQKGNSNGFHCIGNNYYVPNIKTGRSYVMYIAHYMYPMYAVIKSSNAYLEDMSKESKWKIRDEKYKDDCLNEEDVKKVFKKNSLTIVYSPRGSESYATLPLYSLIEIGSVKGSLNYENILDILNEIINDLYPELYKEGKTKEVYSTRLIYDLIDEENIIRWKELNEKNKILLKNDIIKNVVERHLLLSKKEREMKIRVFENYIDFSQDVFLMKNMDRQYKELLLIQLFKAVRVLWGGFRGA
jgi:CRISPR-associated protein Cmr2